jgi:hypothetical protein
VLRPKTFYANARDLSLLEDFVKNQAPRYAELRTPTVIISGERDNLVSPQINARALAAAVPGSRLVLLKNVGHMPHHAAPKVVAAAIAALMPKSQPLLQQATARRRGSLMGQLQAAEPRAAVNRLTASLSLENSRRAG